MATIQELSQRCGVSISTVSKALNGYSDISDKTRELVIKTANEMGYFPNAGARTLKLKKTYNIGILFNTTVKLGLKNEYFAHILEAFREEARKSGYDITLIDHYVGRRKMTYLEHCEYRHFDGVCIICTDFEDEEVIRLVNSDIPVVTIDYAFQKAYSIISDNYGGMKQLTSYVISQGHREIALIHGIKSSLVTKNRIDAFYDVLSDNGIKMSPEYVIEGQYRDYTISEEIAFKLLKLPKKPTCIMAPDDLSALGVMSAIRRRGLKPMKDISVTGYDGVAMNSLVGPKLTSVKQERDLIGKEAARKLIKQMESGKDGPLDTIFMKQTLMIGNSVRKIV